eukprot:TRINITY_DN22639_c0_g1_i1.p1 TRINITY_DN22639_c0_g1~~TRINITY_DN22639_c0_g1_i1.p1  ORF type:complete len:628 (+),score=244.82 TRINITY_DN22639_c0_g1_i1:105-1988(+)
MGTMETVLANLKRKKALLQASPQAAHGDCPRVKVVENTLNALPCPGWYELVLTPHALHLLDVAALKEVAAVRWEDVTRLSIDEDTFELEVQTAPGGIARRRGAQEGDAGAAATLASPPVASPRIAPPPVTPVDGNILGLAMAPVCPPSLETPDLVPSFDEEEKEVALQTYEEEGAPRLHRLPRRTPGVVLALLPEDAGQVVVDLRRVWDAFRHLAKRDFDLDYPPGVILTGAMEEAAPPTARESIVDLATGRIAGVQVVQSPCLLGSPVSTKPGETSSALRHPSHAETATEGAWGPRVASQGPSLVSHSLLDAATTASEGTLMEPSPQGAGPDGEAPNVWLPNANTGLNMSQLMHLSYYNVKQFRAAGLGESFVQNDINIGALREVRNRPKPKLSEDEKAAILHDYKKAYRAEQAAAVNEEVDKLLAESKLKDPVYISHLGQSAAAVVKAIGRAKEDWDLQQEGGAIEDAVGGFWSEHQKHRDVLGEITLQHAGRTAASFSHSGMDDDILGELLGPLSGNRVLTSLSLAHNPITDAAVGALCEALFPAKGPANTALTDLTLQGCDRLTPRTAALIIAAARRHTQLRRVALPDGAYGAGDKAALERTLMLNLIAHTAPGAWPVACEAE